MSVVPAPGARAAGLLARARATAGFLDTGEGERLYALAAEVGTAQQGALVEIGSYRGRSTLFLAAGVAQARDAGAGSAVLLSVDHHRGSEEMQAGWEHHDPSLVDPVTGKMDSLPALRANLAAAGAEDLVVVVVGDSPVVARHLVGTAGLVFVDGGHAAEVAEVDYHAWAPKVAAGGLLCFHDVFADPADGGQAPYACYRDALASGRFVERGADRIGSLRVLERRVR